MYLNISCPNITYVLNRLSQFVTAPKLPHLQVANHLLKYLKLNPSQGLFLSSIPSLKIRAFTNFDRA